jgi:hypothetical protein
LKLHLSANSFLFRKEDFLKILQEPNVEYVRLYLGLKITPAFDVQEGQEKNILIEKLICVGADHNRIDILQPATINDLSGVYDFSHPCPPLCNDEDSPLAGGENS